MDVDVSLSCGWQKRAVTQCIITLTALDRTGSMESPAGGEGAETQCVLYDRHIVAGSPSPHHRRPRRIFAPARPS